ncbi:MAG: sulfide:quinone oxidoreductase [Acidobacteriota bacterium]|jgi:sulfide:quinone oxidoreductase|nr:sulfide:quinone oxidoreductase [Acidobacteriota bacterium]
MANILILGGGFGGVVAAEQLAKTLSTEHQITVVSRSRRFTFYPALVRLAFGKCEAEDISYDLRDAMLDHRVRFIEAEVAHVDPPARKVSLHGGDIDGDIKYDYLVYALGRRLATEQVKGFFEHAHHLLGVKAALKFGEAARDFRKGHAVIGSCPGARLDVPVYETAFALARQLEERGDTARITILSPDYPSEQPGGADLARALQSARQTHRIEFLANFPIVEVTNEAIVSSDRRELKYDLLMLVPPFEGTSALSGTGLTDDKGYVRVDHTMRVLGAERMYAVGDAVYFSGPKMGHMAVHQAEVAAENLAAEIEGREPSAHYNHEMTLVVDEGGKDTLYLHKGLWEQGDKKIGRGRFWGWAKRAHEKYFQAQHS